MRTLYISTLAVLTGVLVGTRMAHSQLPVLLQVNVLNPSSVTFTTTGNSPAVNVSGDDSIDLEQFLTQDVGMISGAVGGNLMAPGIFTRSFSAFWTGYSGEPNVDCAFASGAGGEIFVTTTPAFTGSANVDFSAWAAALPALGARGDIGVNADLGNPGYPGTLIGQWEAVPEAAPLGWAMIAPVGAFLVLWHRKRTCA